LDALRPALPFSTEGCHEATKSEIRRWLKNGSVVVNGERMVLDELIDFPIFSLVFFPSGKRRTTVI
jgi:ribose 1,5-bisphosphokinase PhnN